MALAFFENEILRVVPPWLQRLRGEKLMRAFGSQIDALVERLRQGVKLRFPGYDPANIDLEALATIGRERRIRRGPDEAATTYAARLLTWWDDHRGRGGAYALLRQLRAFWRDTLVHTLVDQNGNTLIDSNGNALTTGLRIDVVYASGTRRRIDDEGTITRDAITWNADGTALWARFWVFFYLDVLTGFLVDDVGNHLIDSEGNALTWYRVFDGYLTESESTAFTIVPREWSAGHIDQLHVVLLYKNARLVGYPPRELGIPGDIIPNASPVDLLVAA
jgi:hypothetical protein